MRVALSEVNATRATAPPLTGRSAWRMLAQRAPASTRYLPPEPPSGLRFQSGHGP
jgi:hypothetical protein